MNTYLQQLFIDGNPDKLIRYVDGLDQESFSLVTFIDTLVPALVMESNLRFGSFHLIKMSLFLRKLSRKGVFSAETERELAKLILQHLYNLEWVRISADPLPHSPEPVDNTLDLMLSEIADGNAHNAYFYASRAFYQDKGSLFNALLCNGSMSISDTIGHSISCIYPVLEEVINADHPAAGTSLLSLIMYLCRYRQKSSANAVEDHLPITASDKSQLLARAASGTGIVEIHHMITFYICQAWAAASWNSHTVPPWQMLTDWIADKTVDADRQAWAMQIKPADIPENYQEWQKIFTGKNREVIINTALSIVDDSWVQACDWFFRVYADYYTADWDPHYYTSLYAALELCRDQSIAGQDSKMALIQALEYFLDDIM